MADSNPSNVPVMSVRDWLALQLLAARSAGRKLEAGQETPNREAEVAEAFAMANAFMAYRAKLTEQEAQAEAERVRLEEEDRAARARKAEEDRIFEANARAYAANPNDR
ncbi:hypothetical protein [Corallococcus terminator]|uniref:Uncharacterized protein n=1 Tax=Corallococcus terminator TaxID=2316733 RepID=A0A3A8I4I3_9BACT|nr:hypothetical protein [Corallococcus terminator]RKG77666.1 hypothetical protein D7V88_30735 [Corallococcus terminator]